MRLRSTQFVFLLLLLCSVQLGEDYTRLLSAEAPALLSATTSSSEGTRATLRTAAPAYPRTPSAAQNPVASYSTQHRRPAMTSPAASAAAVQNHTSLLRA